MTQKAEYQEWSEVGDLLGKLYQIVARLEKLFPERKFTPDGHLVGSIGEALAKDMFNLRLLRASAPGHDATTADGRTNVQIKLTQGRAIALGAEPEHLLVLRLDSDLAIEIVYNGRGTPVWLSTGKVQKNGTRVISVSKLRELDADVLEAERLPLLNEVDMRRQVRD